MTEEKIIETFNKATSFINKVIKTYNNYIDKINGYLDDLEELINNAKKYTEQFIKTKVNKIISDINKIIDGIKKKINNMLIQINAWYDHQINIIKSQIILFSFAKLGLPTTKELAYEAAKTIPHPALGIPNLDITLDLSQFIPEIKLSDIPVYIPRLPKVEI